MPSSPILPAGLALGQYFNGVYENGEEGKVGHNPHPKGRVTGNILRSDPLRDGYDKFFLIPKVRQHAEDFLERLHLIPYLFRFWVAAFSYTPTIAAA